MGVCRASADAVFFLGRHSLRFGPFRRPCTKLIVRSFTCLRTKFCKLFRVWFSSRLLRIPLFRRWLVLCCSRLGSVFAIVLEVPARVLLSCVWESADDHECCLLVAASTRQSARGLHAKGYRFYDLGAQGLGLRVWGLLLTFNSNRLV